MRSIELFAGAGGLGLGVAGAGFDHAAVVEWDRWACDTLKDNKPWPVTQGDVRLMSYDGLGTIDLVSGGPPCQPFSLGGKHNAHLDHRDMFPEAIRAVRELQPRAFVFENVKGLTRASFQNYFAYVNLQLEHPEIAARNDESWEDHLTRLERHHTSGKRDDLHYRVVWRLLNAADHGVPQRRERVFFVGFRDDQSLEWTFPQATHDLDALLWDQSHGTYWDRHEVSAARRRLSDHWKKRAEKLTEKPATLPWCTVRDALEDLPDPCLTDSIATVANHQFQPGARAYVGHTGSPLDGPAKTLKAGVHGVPGGENMLVSDSDTVRYFTVRESARLQTFPDNFVFHGAWSETMRQLGNAVPVKLARVVGDSVAQMLWAAKRRI